MEWSLWFIFKIPDYHYFFFFLFFCFYSSSSFFLFFFLLLLTVEGIELGLMCEEQSLYHWAMNPDPELFCIYIFVSKIINSCKIYKSSLLSCSGNSQEEENLSLKAWVFLIIGAPWEEDEHLMCMNAFISIIPGNGHEIVSKENVVVFLLTMNQARGYAEAHKTVFKYEEILDNGLDLKTCEGRYQ